MQADRFLYDKNDHAVAFVEEVTAEAPSVIDVTTFSDTVRQYYTPPVGVRYTIRARGPV